MMEVYPVKFEAYDGTEPLFKVEMFDGDCATVTISSVMTVELWDDVAPKIRECLVAMKLEVTHAKGEE